MSHVACSKRQQGSSKQCPAGRQATIFVIAIVDGVCRAGFRATSSAKLNTGERQCRRGKILALDKRQRQRQLRQRDSGLGPGKPNPRPGTDPDKKGAALSLSLSQCSRRLRRWLISWQSWFQSANVYAVFSCPFSFFFFLLCLLLRVLVAWGFAGWQELWHYPYLERSIAET